MLAADNRVSTRAADGTYRAAEDDHTKITIGANGVFSGTGEKLLIDNIMKRFVNPGKTPISLQQVLEEEFENRLSEAGLEMEELLRTTGFMFTTVYNDEVILAEVKYKNIDLEVDVLNPYALKIQTVEHIASKLEPYFYKLYDSIKPFNEFETFSDFQHHHIKLFKRMFKKLSKEHTSISPSFDICFQATHNTAEIDYVLTHVEG